MEQIQPEKYGMITYTGVFLTCFADLEERCFHAMPEHVLFYLYSGEQTIVDRNRKIKVKAGECAFIRRDHRIEMFKYSKGKEPYKSITLSFDRNVIRDIYNKMSKSDIPADIPFTDDKVIKVKTTPDITSLFHSLTPYFDEHVKPTDKVVYLKLMEAIYAMLEQSDNFYPILFDFANPWKIDILEFLNNNFMDDLSIEEIAAYTGRSLSTFKRDFKNISNISPQKWILKKRLEVAYQMLKEGKRVSEVYVEVGFKNPSHFSTAFKKEYNLAPTEVLLQKTN
ncbi:helix-turn-helix domain-containing protein [Sphingobacterium sp. WOUb80]|uniref:helix-turn-helix domain-containing protein n=1 Tax=Sphingobacterium sp. WOUb80 TaxID=3234028 RepID=UPI003CF23885